MTVWVSVLLVWRWADAELSLASIFRCVHQVHLAQAACFEPDCQPDCLCLPVPQLEISSAALPALIWHCGGEGIRGVSKTYALLNVVYPFKKAWSPKTLQHGLSRYVYIMQLQSHNRHKIRALVICYKTCWFFFSFLKMNLDWADAFQKAMESSFLSYIF